jgi:uncharacterized protein
MNVVVSDTSPLQYLHLAQAIDVLFCLFERVIVPPAVVAELRRGRELGHDLPIPESVPWFQIMPPERNLPLPDKLGQGEQQAISLAAALGLPVLVDDGDARACAKRLGLAVVGTFGVLLRAKRHGLIPRVGPAMQAILAAGFRADQTTVGHVLDLAGEPG